MTESLPLQFMKAARTAIETALRDEGMVGPTQPCAYLDRLIPIGENDPKPCAVIRLQPTPVRQNTSTCALDHSLAIAILLHVKRPNLITPFLETIDPVFQVVNTAMLQMTNTLPWCQNVSLNGYNPEPETADGSSVPGLMVIDYTASIMTNLNLTAPP